MDQTFLGLQKRKRTDILVGKSEVKESISSLEYQK